MLGNDVTEIHEKLLALNCIHLFWVKYSIKKKFVAVLIFILYLKAVYFDIFYFFVKLMREKLSLISQIHLARTMHHMKFENFYHNMEFRKSCFAIFLLLFFLRGNMQIHCIASNYRQYLTISCKKIKIIV